MTVVLSTVRKQDVNIRQRKDTNLVDGWVKVDRTANATTLTEEETAQIVERDRLPSAQPREDFYRHGPDQICEYFNVSRATV
ncbi:MAG TPA: hypothetical protein VJN63_02340 [Thermoplasmata archaeon]|nr:hypothetical protein [Thermoplasmata archaeon]